MVCYLYINKSWLERNLSTIHRLKTVCSHNVCIYWPLWQLWLKWSVLMYILDLSLVVHPLLQEGCWYVFKVKLYLLQLGRVLGILALNLQTRGHSANWHVSHPSLRLSFLWMRIFFWYCEWQKLYIIGLIKAFIYHWLVFLTTMSGYYGCRKFVEVVVMRDYNCSAWY